LDNTHGQPVIPKGITGVGVAQPRVLDNTYGQPVVLFFRTEQLED